MSEQIKEELFQKWIIPFKGRMWMNTENMPEGVYGSVQMYEHYLCHGRTEKSPEVIIEEEKFKRLTGYNIKDFFKYKDEKEKILFP